ncbi:MAG TPA: hypothetical protein VD731_01385 [Nitrosopumilaceae archaeon]|nr:hypothetical protein [Nitrosopumilaceae archaeon]
MTNIEKNLIEGLIQIRDSYQILKQLRDTPGDLEIIKNELTKINGLLQILVGNLKNIDNSSDKYVKLLSAVKFYLENYSFEREIETISMLYSNDTNRLKNIRISILDALQDKKLMEKVESIIA